MADPFRIAERRPQTQFSMRRALTPCCRHEKFHASQDIHTFLRHAAASTFYVTQDTPKQAVKVVRSCHTHTHTVRQTASSTVTQTQTHAGTHTHTCTPTHAHPHQHTPTHTNTYQHTPTHTTHTPTHKKGCRVTIKGSFWVL